MDLSHLFAKQRRSLIDAGFHGPIPTEANASPPSAVVSPTARLSRVVASLSPRPRNVLGS